MSVSPHQRCAGSTAQPDDQQDVVPRTKAMPLPHGASSKGRLLAVRVTRCLLQEKEEEARLASMPAWRRDILRKKLEEER